MAVSVWVFALGGRALAAPESTRAVQVQLADLGFGPGPLDGIYGPRTRGAVHAFQIASELRPTGRLDAATLARLEEVRAVLRGAVKTASGENSLRAQPIEDLEHDEAKVIEMFSAASVEAERVRLMAVQVMGEIRSARSRAALGIVLYGNAFPSARSAAARELGKIADAPSLYTLALALDDERDPAVREVITAELDRAMAQEHVLFVPMAPQAPPAARAPVIVPTITPVAALPAGRVLVGILEPTGDPNAFRGRTRPGTISTAVDGDHLGVGRDGYFTLRLDQAPAGAILVLVQEMNAEGEVRERYYRTLSRDEV